MAGDTATVARMPVAREIANEGSARLDALFKLLQYDGPVPPARYRSPFEWQMSELLLKSGIQFLYEQIGFPLGMRKGGFELKCVPDFVTDLEVDGKIVVIETKGKGKLGDEERLRKWSRLVELYGDRWYIILVTNMSREELDILLRRHGIKGGIATEVWHTGNISDRRESSSSLNQQERFVLNKLNALKARALRRDETGVAES